MKQTFDVAVVGAGVLGLAHAYHCARRGLKVAVFERSPRAQGASIRNFGMIWPVGQPAGAMRQLALRSRELWLELLPALGAWHEPTGSLHLAYRDDEARVLREFAEYAPGLGYDCQFVEAAEVRERSKAVRLEGLLGGLWSPTEVCVDPREVIATLPGYLERTLGVRFFFGHAATAFERPRLCAGGTSFEAANLIVCSGADCEMLYPALLQSAGMVRCKLQMLRSRPYRDGFRLGPLLAGGLTLRHYSVFENCPSLPELRRRVAEETPEYDRFGIHVMASQNGRGELVLGDSHEYGDAIGPFDKDEIDRLILDYLATFLDAPDLQIAERWHGIYAKHPTQPYLVLQPETGATIVTGIGGAGMTLSFGVAERITRDLFGGD